MLIASDKKNVLDHPQLKAHRHPPDFNTRLNKRYRFIERMLERNVHPFKVFDKFYEFLDKSLKEAYPAGTCKRGCSYCCHVGVAITPLEAQYIEAKTGHTAASVGHALVDIAEKRPCPFLANGECSIYAYRPAVCRAFISFDDVEYCKNSDTSHFMLALNPPGTGGFEWANQMYSMIISFYLTRFPEYRKTNDIRAFFAKTQAP